MSEPTDAAPDTLAELVGDEQISAGVRSQLFLLFGQALSYPDDALCDWIRSGALSDSLREGLTVVAPALCESEEIDWSALTSAGNGDELAIEYTRLFDAGASGPPCPLYGGLYGGARMKTMEECVRFYNHFGLTLSETQRELPDHLQTQLDFLHFLCFREAQALQQDADPAPFRRAQRDFITRQPGAWLPRLTAKLSNQQAAPFFAALLELVAGLLAQESQRLSGTP